MIAVLLSRNAPTIVPLASASGRNYSTGVLKSNGSAAVACSAVAATATAFVHHRRSQSSIVRYMGGQKSLVSDD
jgi:hypothetical protein